MRAVLVALPLIALAAAHKPRRQQHHRRNMLPIERDGAVEEPRDEGVSWANATELEKRGDTYTGVGTYYFTGLGACGLTSSDSDLMVAMNSDQYGSGYPGPQCFKYITIQGNGVTVGGIEVLDECPTCAYGSLDLSPGLFQSFANTDAGTVQITWWFDGSGSSSSTTYSSTSTWVEPTSTWVAPSSTSTWTPSSSTTTWAAPSSTSTWTPPTSSSTWVAPTSSSTSSAPASTITSSTWSSAQLNSTASYNSTTNQFAVVATYNGTSASASISASAFASGSSSDSTSSSTDSQGNLEAINGLVTNYGQLVVAAAGGYA